MSYQPKVYRKQGGDELVVASGGEVTVASGGTLTLESGSSVVAASGAAFDGIQCKELTFTEVGEGTYTGAVTVPAGATVVDIIIEGTALWDAATSASLEVGDADDADGYFTAIDLKATDLLADQTVNFDRDGGVAGAYLAGSATHWTNRYSATARVVTATVASVGAGTAGRTRVTVLYSKPATVTAATFEAA